ncbi:winged helix-turn-helix transcriptional regulator, partial [Candidatus Dependentiae bacterium]|nr:winged helix-turn-helix transcriptional regulator [Candidatus Dependentiae bacterium]
AHPLRLQIVMGLLHKKNCNVNTMSEKLGIPQPSVSQHLTILKNCKVISGERTGNQICYFLSNDDIRKMLMAVAETV